MEYSRIDEIATQNFHTLDFNSTFKEAVEKITETGVHNLVVYDDNADIYGYIGVNEIVKFASKNISTSTKLLELGLHPLVVIPRDYDVLKASTFFLNDISILGIGNEDGSLFGTVNHFDILSVGMTINNKIMESPIEIMVLSNTTIKASPDDLLDSHLKDLSALNLDCIIVEEDKKPIGIITKRDITRLLAQEKSIQKPMKEYMSSPLKTFNHDISIQEALNSIQKQHHKRIIVTNEDGKLNGIITERALVNLIYSTLAHKSAENINQYNQILTQKLQEKVNQIEEDKVLLQTIIDSIPMRIFWKDKDGVYLGANKQFLEDENLSYESDIIGKDDFDMVWKNEAEIYRANDKKVIDSRQSELNIVRNQTQGEENIVISTSKVPLIDHEGNSFGVLGINQDITSRKTLELSVQESFEMLKISQRMAKIGSWKFDVIKNKLEWSDEIFRIFEISNNLFEASYESFLDAIHPDDRDKVNEAYTNSLETQLPYEIRHRLLMKDGTIKWVLETCETTFDKDKNPLVSIGTVQDITKQVTMQEKVNKARESAEQASIAKSDFLTNMSHEIRTPMTGMLGFVERLIKDEIDTERLKKLKVVENSGHTLLEIINDILDFSKIENGKIELESFPFNISQLFDNSLDTFSSLSSTKNITLHKMIDENLPASILGDQTRLKQVVFNLMSNASKFTSDGGNITLQVRYQKENQSIYIAVIDNGVGIAKDNLEKIFEAFSQEDVSTTRKFGGTGLGLSISSHLVRLMGSELKVESTVGKGSKFYFELPIEISSQNSSLDEKAIDEAVNGSSNLKGHILVVEDNKTNQMLMSMILDDLDLTYDVANDGAEGVLNFRNKKYDAILMDENMPIMNGIEATILIRELEIEELLKKTPIIAVTANALTGDKEKFIEAGMDDYIPKPYSEEDIVKVLQKYLG